ncbi:MAG TPA: MFS transporter [Rugosimonospora sp.]|nr:MFS transporter [Rugosimonospora sp.]
MRYPSWPRGRPGRPPGDRDFLAFWVSETTSLVGMELTHIVLPLVAILTLRAGPFQVGLVNAVLYAPALLFSLPVGVWLDRHRRRVGLLAVNGTRAVVVGLIPLAAVASVLTMPLLLATTFVLGALTVAFEVGSLSYLPTLVDRGYLATANGRIQASFSLAAIAGPSLGGLLAGTFNPPVALTATALGFAVSVGMLSAIRRPEPPPPEPHEATPLGRAIREGLRSVYADSVLRHLLTQSAVFNVFYNAIVVLFVVYVTHALGLRPGQLGAVLGCGAVAALLAAVLTGRITHAVGLGRVLRVVTYGVCLSPLLMLIPRDRGPAALALLVAYQAISGFGLVVWNINTLTLRQTVTPDRLLGRMNASYRMVLTGAVPVGALLGGGLGQFIGVHAALVSVVLLLTTPILWTFFSPVYQVTRMPTGGIETMAETPPDTRRRAPAPPPCPTG